MIAPVEIGANVFMAAAIFLAGRNSVHSWWLGIVGCSLFAAVQSDLYAQVPGVPDRFGVLGW
jgi:nicotinamide mononucleotide transporter